ncbi:hypothetical protein [Halomonas sp. G11]|uniref:hypothetical protein n=1 Tax=Halomonas sp. G11 TaxID=1684425 RepID=UPI000AE49B0E|nr:hypothetical protein [Halomonas sp. G11]
MNEKERWNHIVPLDQELLMGGVILSEWCSFLAPFIAGVEAVEKPLSWLGLVGSGK